VELVDEKSSTLKMVPGREQEFVMPGKVFVTKENIRWLGRNLDMLERVVHGPFKGPALEPGAALVPTPGRNLTRHVHEIPVVPKTPAKELQLPLPGRGMERELGR
jgi:hypothetical protein